MKPSEYIKQIDPVYKGDDAETISEMCAATGLSEDVIRNHVNTLLEAGKLKKVSVHRNKKKKIAYIKVK